MTQQRSGQPGGLRIRVELKAAGQTRSPAWVTEAAIVLSSGVSLRNSTKDSLLRNSTKETWSLKSSIYLERIRKADDNYSSHRI